jgi:pyruvate/2-oxoglutarate dehydrogenase complex dihydrolipoamide dehydrogenase (E3) component
VATDLVVHAAGRAPDLDALDLTAADVVAEKGRLKLNEFLQSVSNPKVYAAGDAASSGPPLTPVSSHDGKVIAGNLLDGNSHKPDYRGVPSVAFTIPPIAAVGLSEAEAKGKGLKFRINSKKVSELLISEICCSWSRDARKQRLWAERKPSRLTLVSSRIGIRWLFWGGWFVPLMIRAAG